MAVDLDKRLTGTHGDQPFALGASTGCLSHYVEHTPEVTRWHHRQRSAGVRIPRTGATIPPPHWPAICLPRTLNDAAKRSRFLSPPGGAISRTSADMAHSHVACGQ